MEVLDRVAPLDSSLVLAKGINTLPTKMNLKSKKMFSGIFLRRMKICFVRTLYCTYCALAHIVRVVSIRGIFLLLIDEWVCVGVGLMEGR